MTPQKRAWVCVTLGATWIGIIALLHSSEGAVLPWVTTTLASTGTCLLVWRIMRGALDERIRVAEAETLEARSAFKQVVENLPVGLFTLHDQEFQFSNWSWDEQMMRLPGQSPTQSFRKALHPQDRDAILDSMKRYEEREEPFQIRFRLLNEFGELRYVESQGVPVYGPDGNFLHLLGFNVDVTNAERATHDLDAKNKDLEIALADLEDNLQAMVSSLVKAIEAKDPYTAGHSERVMDYSVRLGEAIGLSRSELKVLRMGTLIHDIGKIGVPDDILTKPGALTDEEFQIIKRHPVTGYNMIRDIPFFRECAPIVRWHHERLNGRGYPDGISGDELSVLVRISVITDMYDAMTSNRAYRRSLGTEVALSELRKEADKGGVDGELVEEWARLLKRDGLRLEPSSEYREAA